MTGLAGSGKSTVLQILAVLGLNVIDADAIAREVRADPSTRSRISEALGLSSEFTSVQLRDHLLGDEASRRRLNQILHPKIFASIAASTADVVEVPLLVEAVLFPFFEETWFIYAPEEVIERRLAERLGSSELAGKLLDAQLSHRVKEQFCTRTIYNSGTLADLRLAVEQAARSSFIV